MFLSSSGGSSHLLIRYVVCVYVMCAPFFTVCHLGLFFLVQEEVVSHIGGCAKRKVCGVLGLMELLYGIGD